ncbi:MAG: pilus assembly protein PilM [Phycisphaerae bacterium]|nr:pilus assembly protein PilM [Phycisphaerae bacterium]
MLDFLFQQDTRPIGLDIGHTMIKMIQLSRQGESWRVDAAEEADLDPHLEPGSDAWRTAVIEALRGGLHRGSFAGRQVVSCLPGDVLKIKSLRLDTADPDQIEEIIFSDVAPRFGLDATLDEIRYHIAGTVYQGDDIKNEVIFFGIDRDQLAAHIDLLEQSGLEPVAIETVPGALFRSFQATLRRREDQDVVSVFVDLGSKYTTVIIGRGQEMAFIKQIPLAGRQFSEQVASRLGISLEEAMRLRTRLHGAEAEGIEPETAQAVRDAMTTVVDELAHEISLCFKYYAVTFRGRRPSEAVFAGGEAYEPALMEALKRHLGVEIRIAEPLRGFDLARAGFDRRHNPQLCEWTIAVGLALKGFEHMSPFQPESQISGSVE